MREIKKIYARGLIYHKGSPITTIHRGWWQEKGVFSINNIDYKVYRESPTSKNFLLEQNGTVIARAKKPSPLILSFSMDYREQFYILTAASASWGRYKCIFYEGDRMIGSVSPPAIFSRKAVIDLPDVFPIGVQVFIIWLVLVLWLRDEATTTVVTLKGEWL